MTLFSDPAGVHSHRTRLVLAEKGITHEVVDVTAENTPEDLLELNPYGNAPTLVDRDLVIYGSQIIMEYLDERFPHPPLMPVDPVSRARCRLMLLRIERDWYPLLDTLAAGEEKTMAGARKELRDGLLAIAPLFEQQPFLLGEEFSLADCALAPVLWRLPMYGIDLAAKARPVLTYAEQLFRRSAFKESLSDVEREMRS